MRRLWTAVLVGTTGIALGLGACGSNDSEATGGQILTSDKQRVAAPQVTADDLRTQVAGNTDFAFDVYQQLRGKPGNVFYSPHSISGALAMLYAGARTTSEQQMATALHFDLPQDRLHAASNKLDLELSSRGQGAKAADGKAFRLRVVNAIWGQIGFDFLTPYLDTLAINYGAGLRGLDFVADPEGSRQEINGWVEEQTEARIKDLIPEGKIDSGTTLVLTNAIYFNAAWAVPFEPKNTKAGQFTGLDGSQSAVQLMTSGQETGYSQLPGLQAAVLPYDGGELSMLLIVPDAGQFDAVEQKLDRTLVDEVLAKQRGVGLTVSLPKFEIEHRVEAKPVLQALGMVDPFSAGEADLSGIDGRRDLFVTDVLHKAFVKVNEAGTEAAAATAVLVGRTSAPEPITLVVDRPFIFLIRDHATGAIAFVGRVVKPS